MTREITNSLDASRLYTETRNEFYNLFRNKLYSTEAGDLTKLLKNISTLIDDLNKMEVYARRAGKRSQYHKNCLSLIKQINEAFEFYNQMVFFAKLAF